LAPPAECDPRVERSRQVILEATLDELASAGYGALTIEAVARRAGVSKATVYRHWDGKLELVSDAVRRLKASVQPPDTDDHRERIVGLLRGVAEMMATSRFAACMPALVSAAEYDPALRRFHLESSAERRAFMIGLLDDARHAGQLAADADTAWLAELLVAPIFFRRTMTPEPFPPSEVDRLVDAVLGPHWTESSEG
jgi:TetR/AcrR family transcriptional regulator of autoinduction and epiphytic fitness